MIRKHGIPMRLRLDENKIIDIALVKRKEEIIKDIKDFASATNRLENSRSTYFTWECEKRAELYNLCRIAKKVTGYDMAYYTYKEFRYRNKGEI